MTPQNSIDERRAAARQAEDEHGIIARRILAPHRTHAPRCMLAARRIPAARRPSRIGVDDPAEGGRVGVDVVPHMFTALGGALVQMPKRLLTLADVLVFLRERVADLNLAPPLRDAASH